MNDDPNFTVDKPSWFWRRWLVMLASIWLLVMGAAALVLSAMHLLSDAAFDSIMTMIQISLPGIAVAYIGGAVWDDANFIKSSREAILNQIKKVGNSLSSGGDK